MARVFLLLTAALLVISTTGAWRRRRVCYDVYGKQVCFSTSRPFTNTRSKLPESISKQGVSFSLYTPDKPTNAQLLTGSDSVASSNLNTDKLTRFIIHGFRDRGTKDWVKQMTRELIKRDGSNVIVVDWEEGADQSFFKYRQAAANTRLVGAMLARIAEFMFSRKGISYQSLHLIGHSLGAHVAGYAGDSLGGKIGRITGLDPAGPSFEKYSSKVRLDKSDAMFVDVIHTNGKSVIKGGFGISKAIGDADFYPNGGQNQPGCARKLTDILENLFSSGLKGIKNSLGCSHLRVTSLFTATINASCSFRATPCNTPRDPDKCRSCGSTGCSKMGFNADPNKKGQFYLKTTSSPTYCIA